MDDDWQHMLHTPDACFFPDDASRWRAVQTRDAIADSFFVYAVKTTKVFCRPICKARLARRANVRFFATAHDAQAAGFRPCKRCKPAVAGFMPEERAVRRIRALVDERLSGETASMSLAEMAARTGLSKWHFHRVFRRCVGVTPRDYLRMQRPAQGEGDGADTGATREQQFASGHLMDTAVGKDESSSAMSSVGGSGCGPLSLDDLLVWPEQSP